MQAQYQHPAVKQAFRALQQLSADEETQRRAEIRERALKDEVSLLSEARKEGREEGIFHGLLQGIGAMLHGKFGEAGSSLAQEAAELHDVNTLQDMMLVIMQATTPEQIKSISLNKNGLSPTNERAGQLKETFVTPLQRFIANREFTKEIEPPMTPFDHPSPPSRRRFRDTVCRRAALLQRRRIPFSLGGLPGGLAGVPFLPAQILGGKAYAFARRTIRLANVSATSETSGVSAPLTTSDKGMPRPSTSRLRLLPFFSPIRRVRSNRLSRQRRFAQRPVNTLPFPGDT